MKLSVRIDKKLNQPILRETVETRARFALTRLTPQISAVTISLMPQTHRDGGETQCRVSATLSRGGTIHVQCTDARAQATVDQALDRCRRAVLRSLDRRSQVPSRSSIRTADAGGRLGFAS